MVGRPIAQFRVEFVTAPPNRFRMQSRHHRDLCQSAMSETLGLAASHPAALLFVQAAQQQIELPMIFANCLITRLTRQTPTFVNRKFRGHRPPPSLESPEAYLNCS
ncbi:MAG: hypothetical protein ACKV2Q_10820, partial [Planctomycetaceae bacterium]